METKVVMSKSSMEISNNIQNKQNSDDEEQEFCDEMVASIKELSINSSDSSFNLTFVCDAFMRSIDNRSAILIDLYLDAFSELVKFFNLFGSLFIFVTKDVQAKIQILETYSADEKCGNHYKTVQSMIKFEKESNLLKDNKRPSGARTLLRLHRALQFISTFLGEVTKLEDDHSTSSAAKVAYQGTLSKYHPWLVRQSVQVALYALPYRRVLIERVYGGKDRIPDGGSHEVNKNMTHLSNIADEVFKVTDKLYVEHNLHDLP